MRKAARIITVSALAFSALVCAAAFILRIIPAKVTYTYIHDRIEEHSWRDGFEVFSGVAVMAVILLMLVSIGFIIGGKKKPGDKTIGPVLLTGVCGAVCFSLLMFSYIAVCGLWQKEDYDPAWYRFSDGKHTLVIEEISFLQLGAGKVYQVYSDNRAVVLDSFYTDDGGRNEGSYDIEWYGDHAEITYKTFGDNESRRTIKVVFED